MLEVAEASLGRVVCLCVWRCDAMWCEGWGATGWARRIRVESSAAQVISGACPSTHHSCTPLHLYPSFDSLLLSSINGAVDVGSASRCAVWSAAEIRDDQRTGLLAGCGCAVRRTGRVHYPSLTTSISVCHSLSNDSLTD